MELYACLVALAVIVLSPVVFQWKTIVCWFVIEEKMNKFPGPPKHPVFGNALDIRKNAGDTTKPQIYRAMLEYANKYGPLWYFRVLALRALVSTDPLINAKILKPGPYLLMKHEPSYCALAQLTSPPAPNILSRAGGAEWKAVRRAIAPAFTSSNLKVLFPKLRALCGQVCNALEAQPASVPVDIDATAQRITVDTIAAFGFDRDFGAVSSPDCHCLTVVQHIMKSLQLMNNPLFRLFPFGKAHKECRHWCGEFDKLVEGLISDMEAHPPAPNTIMAHLLACKDPTTGGPLSRAQLKSETGIIWIAGFETTSHTIAWTMGLLAAYPEADRKVAEELDRAGLLGRASKPPPREVSWEDLAALPYLNACILESMRLFPVVCGVTARYVDRDLHLDPDRDLVVPKGVCMFAPFYAQHRNPRLWSAVDDFLPERWLSPNPQTFQPGEEAVLQQVKEADRVAYDTDSVPDSGGVTSKPSAFVPFSQGPRDCVGQALAMLELRTVLSVLLSRYRFTLPADFGGRQGLEDRAHQYVTLQPAGGLPLLVHPR